MKIVYEEKEELYCVTLSNEEGVIIINTNNIVEARDYFIENMTRLFDDAVNKRLKNMN